MALVLAAVGVVVCLATVNLQGFLFFNTYRVDLFSQVFKLILALGFFLIISICSELNGSCGWLAIARRSRSGPAG